MLQACNLPSGVATEEPTVDPMLAVGLTLTSIAELNPPTEALPTFTSLPSLTPMPEFTATPNFTPTPAFAYVTLSTATNCREGASINFPIVDTFDIGLTIEVVGKHPFDNYWYVRSPHNPNVYCWMWGAYATGGNLGNVPVLTPPHTPTPAPTFDANYVNLSSCVGWWARVKLKNTSSTAFKSVAMTIKDTVTNVTLSDTKDGFEDIDGCLLSSIIASLDPDASYTIASPTFVADPTGHLVSLSITLCTETGLGGSCISKTIEFTP